MVCWATVCVCVMRSTFFFVFFFFFVSPPPAFKKTKHKLVSAPRSYTLICWAHLKNFLCELKLQIFELWQWFFFFFFKALKCCNLSKVKITHLHVECGSFNTALRDSLPPATSPPLQRFSCLGVCLHRNLYIKKKKKGIIKNLLCQDHGSQTREFSCSIAQLFHTVLNYKSVKVNAWL